MRFLTITMENEKKLVLVQKSRVSNKIKKEIDLFIAKIKRYWDHCFHFGNFQA